MTTLAPPPIAHGLLGSVSAPTPAPAPSAPAPTPPPSPSPVAPSPVAPNPVAPSPPSPPPPRPPLPPPLPRPADAPRQQPNYYCHAARAQARAALSTQYDALMPMAPMGAMGQFSAPGMHVQPPIVTLLLQEATAWNALTALHGAVSSEARNARDAHAGAGADAGEQCQPQCPSDGAEATAQRQSTYVAGLTQLAAQSDALVAEVFKLRSIVKHKAALEAELQHKDALRCHGDEVLAMGEALARNGARDLAAAAADLRLSCRAIKAQLAQSRAVLQAVHASEAIKLPEPYTRIVIGLVEDDATTCARFADTSAVFAAMRAGSDETHETGVLRALCGAVEQKTLDATPTPSAASPAVAVAEPATSKSSPAPAAAGPPARTFVRRGGRRTPR